MRDLIKKHTDLSESDISILEKISATIQTFAELSGNDIFLDCFDRNQEFAVVIAHGSPITKQSLYEDKVIGKIALPEKEPSVFLARKNKVPIRDCKGITQENKAVIQKSIPIKNNRDQVIAVLAEEEAITLSSDRDEKLKNTVSHDDSLVDFSGMYNFAANYVRDGILFISSELTVTYVNPEARRIYKKLGYNQELLGKPLSEILLSYKDKELDILSGKLLELEIEHNDSIYLIKFEDGANHHSHGLLMILEDLSEIKKKDREIVYKDAAVREMHHRIKNNLQIIVSILNLQISRSQCAETKKALLDNIMRINSIAIIHEALMTSDFDQEFSLKLLLNKIIYGIQRYANAGENNIQINIIGDDVMVASDKAMAIVMVINELITNSLKHAFKDSSNGIIEIVIQKGILYTTIIVKDNGKGFVKNINQESKKSLGLTIVESMVKDKLKGNMEINSNNEGTLISFDFRTGEL